MFKKSFLAAALLTMAMVTGLTDSARASPTMFVESEQGLAWWLRLKLVPSRKADGGISLEQINAFIKARLSQRAVSSPSQSFTPLCYMDFAREADVVSSDRATQTEISETFKEFSKSFSETLTSGGETFLIRVGLFEDCAPSEGTEPPKAFMALVITDQQGKMREFDALSWEFMRLFKRSDGKVSVYGCFACGEVQEINYNPVEREFYYKWIGH